MLRFGIMGPGRIAGKFADAAKSVPEVEVTCVASKSAGRAEEFATAHGIPYAFGDYHAVLEEGPVDAVYIATTNNFHRELIEMALKAGKHVLCEKAMVFHRGEAEELFALAKKQNLFLMEATWSCFLPHVCGARQWIREGKIGRVQSVSAVIGFDCGGDINDRLLNPTLGGGTFYDIGVYPIEIITSLLEEPILRSVGNVRRHPVTGVDERTSFVVTYPSCDAAIQCMFTCNPKEYIILSGTKGYIELPTAHMGKEALLFDKNRREAEKITDESENGFVYEILHMRDKIAGGATESDILPPRLTIEAAGVYDTLLQN